MTILKDLVATRRARLRLAANADQFESVGNPWTTPSDWHREVALATSPATPTRERESALDYVRPSLPPRERLPYVEPKRSIPLSPQAAQLRHQREMLKIALAAGTGKPSRTLLNPATPDERARFIRINTGINLEALKRKEANDAKLEDAAHDHRAEWEKWLAAERALIAESRK